MELYERLSTNRIISRINPFKMAAYNFIYQTWDSQGRPHNGWVARDSLIDRVIWNHYNIPNPFILNRTMNYSYIISEIWGWTYFDNTIVTWTPILLVGKEIELLNEQNNEYEYLIQDSYCYQFMYLQGDNGGWQWGAGGPSNSPLLFDDTFAWFKRAMKS